MWNYERVSRKQTLKGRKRAGPPPNASKSRIGHTSTCQPRRITATSRIAGAGHGACAPFHLRSPLGATGCHWVWKLQPVSGWSRITEEKCSGAASPARGPYCVRWLQDVSFDKHLTRNSGMHDRSLHGLCDWVPSSLDPGIYY